MSELTKPSLFGAIASLLYPASCTICAASVETGEYLCSECENQVSRIVPPFCAKCSEPFDGAITSEFACANCAHRKIHFEAAVVAYRARGNVWGVLMGFLKRRQKDLFQFLRGGLVAHVCDEAISE